MSRGFTPSRRQLVLGGITLAAALPASSSATMLGSAKPLALHDMDDWHRQIGAGFTLAGAPVSLVAVKQGNRQPSRMKRRHNFTAVFEMDAHAAPQGGIHQVRHAELGQTALYLERTIEKGGKARMRASFS
jgi:hypothetical protein